jgi:8-oxo-dGTP pyrophosphatase MutT (NUDIX family)
MVGQGSETPSFKLPIPMKLSSWEMPPALWHKANDNRWAGLVASALVFNPSGKILLIQRAKKDAAPNLWEIPGGAVEKDDHGIIYAGARELWEESGLVATKVKWLADSAKDEIGDGELNPETNERKFWFRAAFTFQVENCSNVKLEPREHQDYVWATEEEVRNLMVGDKPIPLTGDFMMRTILSGFRMEKESS